MNLMKNMFPVLALAAIVGFGTGCASTYQSVPFPNQAQTVDDPAKARIYVVRPTIFGAAIGMSVNDGDSFVGQTGPNGYLCWERTPGATTVRGQAENVSCIPLICQAGGVYYIQQHIRMGMVMARNELEVLPPEEGKRKVTECHPPEGH